MNYKILLTKANSPGPFSIFTKLYGSNEYTLFESNVEKELLLFGKIITISPDVESIRLRNDSNACGQDMSKDIPITIIPTPTPTPSSSPGPFPQLTPTPSPSPLVETGLLPAWLEQVYVTYDVNSHETSLWVNSTESVDLKIGKTTGVPINGLSWLNIPWTQDTWNPGTTDYSAPYDKVFRLNPISFAAGGIEPGTSHVIKIRRTGNISPVYVFNWTSPTTSIPNPTVIVTAAPSNNCSYGPLIYNDVVTYSSTGRIDFSLDGVGIQSFKWRVKFGGSTVVASGITSMTNELGNAAFSPANKPYVSFPPLANGSYTFEIEGNNCVSTVDSVAFTVSSYVPPASGSLLGVYTETVGGRTYYTSKSPGFVLGKNLDGTVSDITPGLNTTGNITRTSSGRYRYYRLSLTDFESETGAYVKLQNIYLPDGLYSWHVFDCDSLVPNYEQFKIIWPSNVNGTHAKHHALQYKVETTIPTGINVVPSWLKLSRKLQFPTYGTPKDWYTINKWVAITDLNVETDYVTAYKAIGVAPHVVPANPQPHTFYTDKVAPLPAPRPSKNDFYHKGRGSASILGTSLRSVYTDEFPENQTFSVYGDTSEYYRGVGEMLTAATGVTEVKNMGVFGSYGGEEYIQWFNSEPLYGALQTYKEAVTNKVHHAYMPGGAGWGGVAEYFTSQNHIYRNVTQSIYFNQLTEDVVMEIIYKSERLKIATKTYQGIDRERNSIFFTMPYYQDLNGDSVLFQNSGETIPFPNGELDVFALFMGLDWKTGFKIGFWSCLIAEGFAFWNSPGHRLGSDTSKLARDGQESSWATWRPTVGSPEPYVSGQNGAPTLGDTGVNHTLVASSMDAAYAGSEVYWNIKDRVNITLSHVAYTSTRGGYVPTGGDGGLLNLNGHGPLNRNCFDLWYIVNGKKGIALKGVGTAGNVIIYENTHLSQHLYEDIVIEGNSFRAYGHQLIVIPL